MTYDTEPLDELVRLFIETGLRSFAKLEADDLDAETARIGRAIIARGDAGAVALRPLLDDSREELQFLGAAWLVKLDPTAAAPTLHRLAREAADPAVGSYAQLALMQVRDNGLVSAN